MSIQESSVKSPARKQDGRFWGYAWDSVCGGFCGGFAVVVTHGDRDSALIVGATTSAFRMVARLRADDGAKDWNAERAGKIGAVMGAVAAAVYHFWIKHP